MIFKYSKFRFITFSFECRSSPCRKLIWTFQPECLQRNLPCAKLPTYLILILLNIRYSVYCASVPNWMVMWLCEYNRLLRACCLQRHPVCSSAIALSWSWSWSSSQSPSPDNLLSFLQYSFIQLPLSVYHANNLASFIIIYFDKRSASSSMCLSYSVLK